jgi:effector-binding domain-containing protein
MTLDQIPIGRFSTITRLTKKALRYYDTKDLLVPGAKDPFTGYRYYTMDQIHQGILIKYLSTLGFTVEEISKYLQAEKENDTNAKNNLLESKLRETEKELIRLQRVATLLDKDQYKEMMKETMSDPTIKEEPQTRIISKRAIGITSETFGRIMGELVSVINLPENKANHVKIVGPPMTLYHDHEYSEEEGEYEVGFPITGKVTLNNPELEVKNIPKRKVASLIHKGSYDTIGLAYKTLYDYIVENGYDMIGPMMDIYISDPNTTKPEEILTEIQAPIKLL